MVVAVKRTLVNTMDVGMVEFTLTLLSADFDKNGMAFITFPTYYNPSIGDMMRCAVYDAKTSKDVETVYCAVAWDYTLKVMGPATAVSKASVVLRVYGVSMNSWSTAQKFHVAMTNSTMWKTSKINEVASKADTATGKWGGKSPINVASVSMTSDDMRGSSDIVMAFSLPTTSDTVTALSDFVAIQLPW